MTDTFRCGNCHGDVIRKTVKCSNGTLAEAWACVSCGETWFPWQIKRDLEWQQREDARKQRKDVKA